MHVIRTNMQTGTFRSLTTYVTPRALHQIDATLRYRYPDHNWRIKVTRVGGGPDRMVIWHSTIDPDVNLYAYADVA